MALKQILLITFGMAATLLVAGCSQEKFPDMPDDGGVRPLRITVTDGGYASDGKNDTRAVENGYTTVFTAGDACGLYIVRNGKVAYDNVKLTATAGAGGILTWQPAEGVTLTGGYTGETYFLYYPYQPNMTDKISATATSSDTGFFKTLISGWQPAADQSTYAKYAACDLMTAKGSATKNTTDGKLLLTFSMMHRMAHAVIDVPKTVYRFANTDVSISDYVVPVDFTGSEVKPYCRETDEAYHCIVKPAGGTVTTITGCYDEDKKDFIILANIAAGSYKRYVVDGAPAVEKTHLLQVGDYYLADGHLFSKDKTLTDEEKKRVIGIVFAVGHPKNDPFDYSQSDIGLEKCHGYVVALQDACAEKCSWGNESVGYNGKSSGYDSTWDIIGKVGVGNLTESNFQAFYYAVVKYQEICPAPINCTGWFLPSFNQLKQLQVVYVENKQLFDSVGRRFSAEMYLSSTIVNYYGFSIKAKSLQGVSETYIISTDPHRVRSILVF